MKNLKSLLNTILLGGVGYGIIESHERDYMKVKIVQDPKEEYNIYHKLDVQRKTTDT